MSGPSPTPDKRFVRILHLEDSRVDHALVKFALQRSQLAWGGGDDGNFCY